MKRVFLIDAMSHVYRAFFAPMGMKQEPLRNSKGQVTQAVFVFTNMLRKLLNDEKPDYIAAVWDTFAPTFRHDSFEDYKANREAMPDDLVSQLPFIERVCEAFSIPVVKLDGYEADDIIGTFSKQIAAKGMQCVIVSNDKDLCQLVRDPNVVAMRQNAQNLRRKVPVPPIEWCDEAWVNKKFGVPPEKIIDLLGLMGDSVDNIPGAPGIGEKGALKLVLEFGSARAAMDRADEVTHKTYRESLQNNRELIEQSLDLATIHCEVPIAFDLSALAHRPPDREKAYELFRELEFKSLINEFSDASAGLFDNFPTHTGSDGGSRGVKTEYSVIKTNAEIDTLIRKLFETDEFGYSVNDANSPERASCYEKLAPLGVGIGLGNGEAFYIDLENFGDDRNAAVVAIGDILTNKFLQKAAFDAKSVNGTLLKLGIRPVDLTDDVMVAAYVLDPGRTNYPIDFLAQAYLDTDIARSISEGIDEAAFRTAEVADIAARVAPVLREKLRSNDQERVYADIELPTIDVLAEMELVGMKVDGEALIRFAADIKEQLAALSARLFAIAGREFNIGSPKQVGEVFSELNIETGKKTATGQISTSHDVLVELAQTYEIAQLIIDYREMDKLRATYPRRARPGPGRRGARAR